MNSFKAVIAGVGFLLTILLTSGFHDIAIQGVALFLVSGGIGLGIGFKENLYGQCWTKTRESDAMWRIYSPNKNGVRIMTTPRKLLTALLIHANINAQYNT